MGAEIVRLDEIEWDGNVPDTLLYLDLWGVKPLIPMIEAALLEVDDGPNHFLINEIGVKVQDLSTALNRLIDTYKEYAEGQETGGDRNE